MSSFCKSYSHFFSKKLQHICVSLDINFNESLTNDDVRFEQLGPAVFSQNNNKTPGKNNVTREIIKASYYLISSVLLNLYNRMFETGDYPSSWGHSIIFPIFSKKKKKKKKKKDANNAQNYRGISLINILAKIYSQLLLIRLTQ